MRRLRGNNKKLNGEAKADAAVLSTTTALEEARSVPWSDSMRLLAMISVN